MDSLECIRTRRSVRKYTSQPLTDDEIRQIIQAAVDAPSGKNGQPWKFRILTDQSIIEAVSKNSIYYSWLRTSPCFVIVFLDKSCSYNQMKDIQSCGASMQNMMLAAHALGIGSCWIGEILPKENEVKKLLSIDNEELRLMGIVSFGYACGEVINVGRKGIEEFII